MAAAPSIRLAKAATIYNVSTEHLLEKLKESGFVLENKPTYKLTANMISALERAFGNDKALKEQADSTELHWRKPLEVLDAEFEQELERIDRKERIYKDVYLVGSSGYIGLPYNDSPECTEYWNVD